MRKGIKIQEFHRTQKNIERAHARVKGEADMRVRRRLHVNLYTTNIVPMMTTMEYPHTGTSQSSDHACEKGFACTCKTPEKTPNLICSQVVLPRLLLMLPLG